MTNKEEVMTWRQLGLAVTVLISITTFAEARDLTVVSYGEIYQDVQRRVYFDPFRHQTGIPLREETWTSNGNINALRSQARGGNPTWDVVAVEPNEFHIGCDEGLFERLDYARIGGKERYIDDAVHHCGVGTVSASYVLGYDRYKVKESPKSWADFFDTRKYPGKRSMRSGPTSTLEIALMADGVPLSEVYKVLETSEGVDRAFRKLDIIKQDIIFWEYAADAPRLLGSGEVVFTVAWNGRIEAANRDENRNFGIVWNQNLYLFDYWVILKGSPNVENAYKLLEFMGRVENQAKLPLHLAYGVSNRDAHKHIPHHRLQHLPIHEENSRNALELSGAFWRANTERLTERFEKWVATR
jgi:putative spermidine/putrescine transport system substrate-binding protein